ncbi:HpcH/HpaI aldolase/citrate lyase family protein [Nocardioides hungaricus]
MVPPRSLLAVPASKPRLLESALRRPVAALMVDLEDGVAPADKDTARTLALEFVKVESGRAPLTVRINDPLTGVGRRDLRAFLADGLDLAAVVVPKSTAASIASVAGLVTCPLIALVETAQGVEEARDIAVHPAVVGLMFGTVDYVADLSSAGGWHVGDLTWASSRIVNAAASGRAWALAGPSTSLEDGDELAREVLRDRSLGFAGKLCIHPGQLDRVNSAFGPSDEQVAWAERVLESIGDVDAGAVRVDGHMVDKPVVDRARTILAANGQDRSVSE